MRFTLASLLWLLSSTALAQQLASRQEAPETQTTAPANEESPSEAGTPTWWEGANPAQWSAARDRWFAAGSLDVGFLYVRPRVSFGWGRPHFRWFGVDVNPIFQQRNIGAYVGGRLSTPFVDWRIGGRYSVGISRSYLTPKDAYGPRDFNIDNGTAANYITLETELTLTLPLGPGELLSESALSYVAGVPEQYHVLETIIRSAVAPPWVSRNRLGYIFAFAQGTFRIGLVAEMVYNPGRDLLIVRAGVMLRININFRIQIRASWIPALNSPDRLGIRGGDFGLLGLRYRFASGMGDDSEGDD